MNRRVLIAVIVALVVMAFAATMFTVNTQVAETNREIIEENAPATSTESEPLDPSASSEGGAAVTATPDTPTTPATSN